MAEKRPKRDKEEPTLELPSLFGRRGRRRPEPAPEVAAEPVPEAAPEPEPELAPEPSPAPVRRRARRSTPTVPAPAAAVVTGLLVGLGGTALTWAGLRGCEALRGTDSCGGPGLWLLVAIVVVMVVLGALVLALLKVPDPRGTSFLGVGLTAVVTLLALMDSLFSPWMFLVVPLVSAAAYGIAHWVTTRFVELPDDGPDVDVR